MNDEHTLMQLLSAHLELWIRNQLEIVLFMRPDRDAGAGCSGVVPPGMHCGPSHQRSCPSILLILDEDSSGLLIQIQLHEQMGGDPSGGIREAGS